LRASFARARLNPSTSPQNLNTLTRGQSDAWRLICAGRKWVAELQRDADAFNQQCHDAAVLPEKSTDWNTSTRMYWGASVWTGTSSKEAMRIESQD
jgi:hypothetical protein